MAVADAASRREWTLDVPEEAVAAVPPPPVAAGAADVPPPPTGDATPALLTPAPGVDLGDVELATLIAFEHALSTVASASPAPSAAVTADLLAWLDLLSVAHPLAACAAGAAALGEAVRARTWPPPGASSPDAAASTFRPCGVDRPRPAGWGACAAVTGGGASSPLNATAAAQHPPRGGFACGLWTLLHSLAARADGSPGGRGAGLWLAGARGYVRSFFPCSDCAAHFLKRTSDEDIAVLIRGAAAAAGGGDARAKLPASSKAAASSAAAPRPELLRRHAASVAAWRVHNDVSARVAAEEAADAASLASARPPAPAAAAASPFVSSKAPWPPASLCAACVCAPVGGTGAAPAVAGTTAAADALVPRPGCEHPLPGAPAGGVWDVLVIAPFLARFYGGSGAAAPAEWDPFGLGQALSATHIPHHGGRAQRRRPSGRSLDAETAGAGAGGAAHAGHIEVDASPVSSSSSAGLFAIVLLVCVVIAAAMAVAVSGARKGGGRGRGNSPRNGMSSSSHGASWLKAVRRWIVARAGGRRHHHSGDGLGILGRAGVKSV